MTLTKPFQRRRPAVFGPRARSGFSILEMLVVVVLVGIIMSVAGVRVSGMMVQQRVIRAASTIQTDMELAFAVASRNREPTKLLFSSSSAAILLRVTNRAGTQEFRSSNLKTMGLNNGDVTVTSSDVTVFPNGFASTPLTVTVSVTNNGVVYKRVVTMTRAGMVKVI
jgi:prepilin-type N-terminal cleavage/methylation domain-containing protein